MRGPFVDGPVRGFNSAASGENTGLAHQQLSRLQSSGNENDGE